MNFRTTIKTEKQNNTINHKSNLVLIGSCFTQNIGDKLNHYKFNTLSNPFGILFQPKAIENLITASLNDKEYTKKELIFYNERWHCFDTHSNLSHKNNQLILTAINTALKQTKKELLTASHIIITLGTSWVYRFIESNSIVANCHKIPQKKFKKELLSIREIVASLSNIIDKINTVNPTVEIIFTLSPVRHLKDGFVENKLSKSHLLSAIHQIIKKNVHYFPAFEIMMDDLRDYRFYKKDMVHPNETAIDYIWDKFIDTWINSSEKELMEQITQIQKGLAHKPFNEKSKKHQLFLQNLQEKIKNLEESYQIYF